MNLIGRIICAVTRKHRRGRVVVNHVPNQPDAKLYQCPRCGATWTRKSKVKK